MPALPKDYELQPGQRADPIVWITGRRLPVTPNTSDAALEPAFGEGRGRKLKSWGHTGPHNVHWLVTRGGTPLHNDPNYPRYTHHLILRNDGFRIRGLDDTELPMMEPGTLYCLDAHSPHWVVPDERLLRTNGLERPLFKVQVAVDFDDVLDVRDTWDLLSPKVFEDPAESAAAAAVRGSAPRPAKSGEAPAPYTERQDNPASALAAWRLL